VTREQILGEVRTHMAEMFEIDASSIQETSKLQEDLDLDSIDAIDLAVKMQELTGKRVEEAQLRSVRTVGDVVDLIDRIVTSAG
jgi:acyl carrier protein